MTDSKYLKIKNYWHFLFEYAVIIKGFNGVWETISGLLFLSVNKELFNNLFYFLFSNELLEDPHDPFINFIAQSLHNIFLDTKFFIAIYILIHGLLNIFLAIQLYRNKLWAYLVAIGAMIIFISYQIYRIILYHSVILTIITILDLLLIFLIWHEYKYQKSLMQSK